MSDTEFDGFATDEQLANLDAIFDKRRRVETKEDILELAKLVEDECDGDDSEPLFE